MMQRLVTKLRCLSVQCRGEALFSAPSSRRLLHLTAPQPFRLPSVHSPPVFPLRLHSSPFTPSLLDQVRYVSSRERKLKRKPMTPVTSKLKKPKMKSYSSYKSRFRTLHDGTIRRWKEGKRHNAHLKSKKAKRRLRKPAIVPVAYAKVMKKLGFCG